MVTACLDETSILRILGLSPLQILLLKYRIKYLTKSKKHAPLQFLKLKLKNGFQRVALVEFANICGISGFYIINLLVFDRNPSITFS